MVDAVKLGHCLRDVLLRLSQVKAVGGDLLHDGRVLAIPPLDQGHQVVHFRVAGADLHRHLVRQPLELQTFLGLRAAAHSVEELGGLLLVAVAEVLVSELLILAVLIQIPCLNLCLCGRNAAFEGGPVSIHALSHRILSRQQAGRSGVMPLYFPVESAPDYKALLSQGLVFV